MLKSSGERAPLWGPILVLGVALGAGLGAGCSQAPAPETAAPEAPAEVASEAPPAPAEAAETPAAPEAAAPDPAPAPPAEEPAATAAAEPDPTVIVIERREREREPEPRTLYEASVAARERRAGSRPSTVSITDENLHEYQGKGLTFAEAAEGEEEGEEAETGGAEEEAGADDDAGPAGAEPERGETYWRTRVRDLRLALRQAVDELGELEERAASLRRSFYAEDDPYVRDAEIKPAWDRALDRIAGTRRALTRMRDELAATLEEGRRAGALPGWLREGIELEPLPEELPPPREGSGAHEPGEPRVIEIGEPPP